MVNPYLFIGLTIVFTVIGQLLVKAGMIEVGEFPGGLKIIPTYLWQSLINWKVLLGLVCAVLASFTWMLAMSKHQSVLDTHYGSQHRARTNAFTRNLWRTNQMESVPRCNNCNHRTTSYY